MKIIWRYPLMTGLDSQTVTGPGGAEFLSVMEENGVPTLYALVDPTAPAESTKVLMVRPQNPIIDEVLLSHRFLGTVKIPGVNLVSHIFVERS